MKKLIAIAAVVVATIAAQAQGTINFANRGAFAANGTDAKVLGVSGAPLDGAGFMAQLYVGASASSLAAVGSPVPFRTGAAAGFVSASTVTTGLAGGAAASVAMRAWDASTGANYDAATTRGSSAVLSVVLGGGGSPPAVPVDLAGLAGFSLAGAGPANIPEPSTVALGLIGAGALFLRRRK